MAALTTADLVLIGFALLLGLIDVRVNRKSKSLPAEVGFFCGMILISVLYILFRPVPTLERFGASFEGVHGMNQLFGLLGFIIGGLVGWEVGAVAGGTRFYAGRSYGSPGPAVFFPPKRTKDN